MLDPRDLYRFDTEFEAGATDAGTTDAGPAADGPVLLVALDGFIDAGYASRLAVGHLFDQLDTRLVATFDIDQLLDYRGRRPVMIFDSDRWTEFREPSLAVHEATDVDGTRFLMLVGPEPDLQWERFSAAVLTLVERLGVRLTVGLNAIPMPVPHTRPTAVTTHGTRPELVDGDDRWFQTAEVPASAAALLEFRLGQAGHDAMGIAAHVPHYLARAEYPSAAHALLARLSRAAGLSLPIEALQEAAGRTLTEIEQQVAGSEQATNVVRALERQYDTVVAGRGQPALIATDADLPTADELGAEVERYLRSQDGTG